MTFTKEDLRDIAYRGSYDDLERELALQLLDSMEQEPVADVVAWSSPTEERTCDIRWRRHDVKPGPLYTAPPAPVVPGEMDLLTCHLDGVTETYAEGWNACLAAMLQGAEPVSQRDELPEWLQQANKLAELHGCSFVVFRHGEEAQCADPTKVIISFTDEGLGHHSAAPQQEVVSQIQRGKAEAREEWEMGARLTKHRFKVE